MPKLRLHQQEALKIAQEIINGNNKKKTTIAHVSPGAGKAQPLDSLILTPTGYVKMGDIKVGDEVLCPNGTTSKIIAVHPQGLKDIYRINFSDYTFAECCEDHLWYLETTYTRLNKTKKRKKNSYRKPNVQPLKAFKDTLIKSNKKYYSIPMVSNLNFSENDKLPIDPYLLGLLLGDGYIGGRSVSLTTYDFEIADYIKNLVPEGVSVVSWKKKGVYGLVGKKPKPNALLLLLDNLGLAGKKSEDKFIPEIYKWTSAENRIEMLRGLLDTDGTVGKPGGNRNPRSSAKVSFTTVSRQLMLDVKFLIESLGGMATVDSRIPTFTGKDVNGNKIKKKGQLAYTIRVGMPPSINPFRLKRKANLYVPKTKYLPTRYISNVEYVGKKEAQCITIDSPNHLYITNNFIVTHNSLMSVIFAKALADAKLINRVVWVCPRTSLTRQAVDGFKNAFNQIYSARVADNNPPLFRDVSSGRIAYATTYQSIAAQPEIHFNATSNYPFLLILDEPHHLKDEKDGAWIDAIKPLQAKAFHTLLMTGTIERHDKKVIPFIEYDEEGKRFYPRKDIFYSRYEALIEEAVVPIEFAHEDGWAEFEEDSGRQKVNISQATSEEVSKVIQTFLSKTEFRDRLLNRGITHWLEHRKKYSSRAIVICSSQAMARSITKQLQEQYKVDAVLAISDEPESQAVIKNFRNNNDGQILVTVGMAYEGLDVPDCKHLICLTNFRSVPWLEQAFARVTRVDYRAMSKGVSYDDQKAYIFVPDDPRMQMVVAYLKDEQDRGLKAKKEKIKKDQDGEKRKKSEWKPIGAESTNSTSMLLSEQLPDDITSIVPAVQEDEKDLRRKIEMLSRRRDILRRYERGTTNKLLFSEFRKPRNKMSQMELSRVLKYLESLHKSER